MRLNVRLSVISSLSSLASVVARLRSRLRKSGRHTPCAVAMAGTRSLPATLIAAASGPTLFAAGLVACFALSAASSRPTCWAQQSDEIRGPLRVHPTNPRYFTDDGHRAVYLTGSHTWNNLVDMGTSDPPVPFDFDAYLQWLQRYNHNFFRLWAWELVSWDTRGNRETNAKLHHVGPQPWQRTGPGQALDGKPRFNLEQLNPQYFDRLRQRVQAAHARGIYAAVMLFEGWGVQRSPNAWVNHPFHPNNNVNGIDGDLNGDGKGLEIHSGQSPEITTIQRVYAKKLIDTVNQFDNVLYEISNENHTGSTAWQYDMIGFIKRYEQTKPKQHPVGMTFQYQGGSNRTLFDSPADWISPNPEGGYRDDPPAADGSKVIITDTDHLWGIGGNQAWVWKSFTRGLNPIFMDPYDGKVLSKSFTERQAEPIRKSMGYTLTLAQQMNLARMMPRNDLTSSGYCLAEPRRALPSLFAIGRYGHRRHDKGQRCFPSAVVPP